MSKHPCFNYGAHRTWGRVHLPVAPHCNIQCNFCNRKYSCVNESRPGVTDRVYTPQEALTFLRKVMQTRSDISVVGIAGPGDPLCDAQQTLETFQLVHDAYPDLMLCVSTNGLALPAYVTDLAAVGVTHLTVTVNAVSPEIASKIYAFVGVNGQKLEGTLGTGYLLRAQDEGIRMAKELRLTVKVNTVVIPGINEDHVVDIARKCASWKVDIMNCISMIPVENTPFETVIPLTADRHRGLQDEAERYVAQMRHCCRCRADAVGKLCASND